MKITELKEAKEEIYDTGTQLDLIAFIIDAHLQERHSENEHRIMLFETRIEIMKIVHKLFAASTER